MIKMVNKSGTLTKNARGAFQGAFICGPFDECIRIPGMYECDSRGIRSTAKAKRIAAILDGLNICWDFEDGYAMIYRVKFFREAVSDLSSAAVSELAEMIPGFAGADVD